MTVTIMIPMRLPSVSNLREHWAQRAKRVKAQRAKTRLALLAERAGWGPISPARGRVAITLTRVAPRQLDDDNLRGALKAVRDEVAAYFGIDDADPRLVWQYAQAKGPVAVLLEFNSHPDFALANPDFAEAVANGD